MACGTLAALGLTAGGTAANMVANSHIRSKMNDLVEQEQARTRGFQQKANQVFDQSFNQSTPGSAGRDIQQGQGQLAGLINNAQSVPLTTSLPSNVDLSQSKAQTGLSNQAASKYGGYENLGVQRYLNNMNANSNLGLIGNEAQGWVNILPAQLQQAQQSQGGLQTLGSLLSTAGLLTGLGGLATAPAAGGVTGGQMAGLGAGLGPITASSVAGLAPSTLAAGNAAWAPWLTNGTLNSFGYGSFGTLPTLPGLFR